MASVNVARIGSYRRVSTRHQVDNDRYAAAFRDMSEVIGRYNGAPIAYDEGGHARSGGTIRGRKVFEAMLADVASGELDGIAAPDVRSLSRGEWMIDGKTIADTLIKAGAILITRDMRYDLRRPGDLRAFQDRLYWAMQERVEVRRRFYEGQAARARNVVEGNDRAWGRHRTMLGHCLELLFDENGQPRITNRGVAKRAWAKDPDKLDAMATLIQELETQPNRGALFTALYAGGIEGPDRAVPGGWTKRSLRTLLRSPFHQGRWPFVRTMKSTVWYGLDPRSDEFDAAKVVAACPKLAYWTSTQAAGWERKFIDDNDLSRRVSAARSAHQHSLLGLLRCPNCHQPLLGKGAQGYICPKGAKGSRATDACLPVFTVRESSAHDALRGLLPLLRPRLAELRDAARAALQRHDSDGIDIHMQVLANEERALLVQLQVLTGKGLSVPESFTERLVEIGEDRKRTLAERRELDQVAEARVDAERALAGIDLDAAAEIVAQMSPLALAEFYRAFFEWVEVKPNGRGQRGGQLLDWMFHAQQSSGQLPTVEHLAALLRLAVA